MTDPEHRVALAVIVWLVSAVAGLLLLGILTDHGPAFDRFVWIPAAVSAILASVVAVGNG